MGSFHGTREIIELEEGVEDEINRLFETIRVSAKTSGLSQVLKDKQKKPMKRPMRGIGISEPVNLKQALRGLTISQASEMAAMKRLTKSKPGFEHVKRSQIAAGDEVNDNNISHQDRSVMELGQIRNLKLKLSSLSTRSKKIKPKEEANKPDPIKETKKKPNEKSRTQEKGEISQSSKSSSHGECSSSTTTTTTTSYSCDSNRSWCRPHMSKDLRWEAVNLAQKHHGSLNLRNFKLIKKIGGGDIGNVYLAELIGSNCLFALKILDNELLGVRKKDTRVQNEKEILQLLDHPFLPTLFSQFTTDKYSCFVIEYCPGGDLHVLRQKQPNKCFSEQAARFYVAEILLALEYLHMHGIIYRDLKPENILIREDGHIMLTDFDLSLRCDPNPTVINPSPSLNCRVKDPSSCIDPFCLQPSCFTTPKPNPTVQITPFPQVIVEPSARSNSFVGTHEYLAPEIINNEGHGSCVDWWTFGILLYEFLYGRTPFKGTGDEDTLANVVSQGLVFPESPIVSFYGKDLIRSLLRKQAEGRLGAVRGAAEIKEHKFFEGLNWALIRCATPPEMPKIGDVGSLGTKNVVFDMF